MPGSTERDLIVGVIPLANLFTRRLSPIFERSKITPQQWAVLSVLAENDGPMSLAGVARKLLVSKQNMTGMVSRLEQLGLAERGDDPNDLRSSARSSTSCARATTNGSARSARTSPSVTCSRSRGLSTG
jgi:hypothetical protein